MYKLNLDLTFYVYKLNLDLTFYVYKLNLDSNEFMEADATTSGNSFHLSMTR